MRAVVVTTKHRGVFFGYLAEGADGKVVEVEKARMCVYWSADVRGVLGLASTGPSDTCKVTQCLSEPMKIYDVTAIMGASTEAAERWERGPWK